MLGLGQSLIHRAGIATGLTLYNYINLDGVNDYIDLGNIGTVRSLQIWFKPAITHTAATGRKRLVGFGTSYYGIHISQATTLFANETLTVLPGANSRTTDTQAYNANQWYHCVISWDAASTVFRIYVNGSDATVNNGNNGSTDALPTFTSLRIGKDNSSATENFQGRVDKIATWSSSLSLAEAVALYNGGQGLYDPTQNSGNYVSSANITGYWHCDASPTVDQVGSNDGTLQNGAAVGTGDSPDQ